MPYQPIENYGIIGDLHTVALVGIDGSIDYMCFPHFDSPSIFCSILDDNKGGRFSIAPLAADYRHKQIYLPDTNVLITRFLGEGGVAEVSDFMPIRREKGGSHTIVRRVKVVRGSVTFLARCEPRFDYARAEHRVHRRDENTLVFESAGPDKTKLALHSSVPLQERDGDGFAEFRLEGGETAYFVLEPALENTPLQSDQSEFVSDTFKETVNFWRRWVGKGTYHGRWQEMVHRSAMTLKLLTSKAHGSIVAAPTFSLPEDIGGVRNWDYRYTWIRDASFTLYGLIRLGYTEEAEDFMRWVEARCEELNPDGSLQIMYGIDGRHHLEEFELAHLEGYRGSSPVRIGNGAYDQLQLDIYGELMDSVYLFDKYGRRIHYDLWKNLTRLIDWVCANWRRKDEGIWEVRGGQQEFLFSRLMCWVAVDRGIRLAQKRSLPAPMDKWVSTRTEIYRDIMSTFWNPQLKHFVQHKGSTTLDASNLLMPLVRFLGPRDPRWLSTLDAIGKELVDDSLVYRYKIGEAASDGLVGDEGTFTMCSFWYVECLSRAGDIDKARFCFEKLLGYANHLGLYAEELGPRGEHLGNFPQAFTHLALISAAYDLDRRLSEAGWRA